MPPLSPTAANSHLTNLSALFNYAVREEYLDKSPAAGLRVAAPEMAPDERREPFTPEQLRRIFAAPLHTGCQDDGEGWSRPGNAVSRRGRFWVPQIALWTGLRPNECCQLLVSDIEQIEGIIVLWVRPAGDPTKRLKSRAARRFVPVHAELRRIGLLHHVDEMRRRDESRRFPELQLGMNGSYSDPFQKMVRPVSDEERGASATHELPQLPAQFPRRAPSRRHRRRTHTGSLRLEQRQRS